MIKSKHIQQAFDDIVHFWGVGGVGISVVIAQCKKPTAQMAHLVFPDTRANAQKTKRAIFFQRTKEKSK